MLSFVGVDGNTYGPYMEGDSDYIPLDDAASLIEEGKATFTPPLPETLTEAVNEIFGTTKNIESSVDTLSTTVDTLSTTVDTLSATLNSLTMLFYITIVLQIIVLVVVVVFGYRK